MISIKNNREYLAGQAVQAARERSAGREWGVDRLIIAMPIFLSQFFVYACQKSPRLTPSAHGFWVDS